MTKKEVIYNALGLIEGAVCVSQKNTREVLMKAINMIKDAVEEEVVLECNHDWRAREVCECMADEFGKPNRYTRYVCLNCGETKFEKTT